MSNALQTWTPEHDFLSDSNLWPHQRTALAMLYKYLEEPRRGAALVRLPTGTGKSGIIAILSCCHPRFRNVLVVTPWQALRTQLGRHIQQEFWHAVSIDPATVPKKVREILPSTSSDLVGHDSAPQVFLCTQQALQSIHTGYRVAYDLLYKHLDLILVDEGHREPAPKWAAAVRGLEKPTILFTATPYRNDHKYFDIDRNFIYTKSHASCTEDGYIRGVEFQEMPFLRFGRSAPASEEESEVAPSALSESENRQRFAAVDLRSINSFVDALIMRYREIQAERSDTLLRVLVRAGSRDEVESLTQALRRKRLPVVGIHERFSGREDQQLFEGYDEAREWERGRRSPAIFWVHQFKLIEGIDDSSFRVLALYRPFDNTRALVQQVGRILRRDKSDPQARGIVLSHGTDRIAEEWDTYIRWDQDYQSNHLRYDAAYLMQKILEQNPEWGYVGGRFRHRFDIADPAARKYTRFSIPFITNVYRVAGDFAFADFSAAVDREWKELDRYMVESAEPQELSFFKSYITFRNSPLVPRDFFPEYSLGFTVSRQIGQRLFFYDSEGRSWPDCLANEALPLSSAELRNLFRGDAARATEITLINGDLGRHSVRRRSAAAQDLAYTAPALADPFHVCGTVTGYSTKDNGHGRVRRYVGLQTARISDGQKRSDWSSYLAWITQIEKSLSSPPPASLLLFQRYAQTVEPPAATTARNILLDLHDAMDSYGLFADDKDEETEPEPLDTEDLCYDVENSRFQFQANGQSFDVEVEYDPRRRKYVLSSEELEEAYRKTQGADDRWPDSLLKYLNRFQPFRIIPEDTSLLYTRSQFYRPAGGVRGRSELMKIMVAAPELDAATTEKGRSGTATGASWDRQSVFGMIHRPRPGSVLGRHLQDFDLLVCDDRGSNEIADFIAAGQGRLAFLHAKGFKKGGRPQSASALQEVCGQAIKNLEYLSPYSYVRPPNLPHWDSPWSEKEIGTVDRRVLRGARDGAEAWQRITDTVQDPSAAREVWIVLGKGLAISALEAEMKKSDPAPVFLQMIYLLQSTWSAAASMGVVLRVFSRLQAEASAKPKAAQASSR